MKFLKNSVEKNEINIDKTIDEFEFNQDNSIDFDEEYRSPGWNRYKRINHLNGKNNFFKKITKLL